MLYAFRPTCAGRARRARLGLDGSEHGGTIKKPEPAQLLTLRTRHAPTRTLSLSPSPYPAPSSRSRPERPLPPSKAPSLVASPIPSLPPHALRPLSLGARQT